MNSVRRADSSAFGDVLLTPSEDLLFTWVWTDELLDEWQEVIVREGKRTSESATSVGAAVRTHFGRSHIAPEVYCHKVTDDPSPDPADRAHAAAAIYGDVDTLLDGAGAGSAAGPRSRCWRSPSAWRRAGPITRSAQIF